MRKLLAVVFLSALAGSARAATPAELFADAAKHEEAAKADDKKAWDALEAAVKDEDAAANERREARIDEAKALAEEKDAKKIKAHELRHRAHVLWHDAHRHWNLAHQERAAEARNKHDAAELTKAADAVKDQKNVHDALLKDAKIHADAAAKNAKAADAQAAAAKKEDAEAKKDWEEAQKLDPEAPKHVTPPAPPASASK